MNRNLPPSTVSEKLDPSATWYLDVLRIVAAFFVIVNHTNSSIFLQGGLEVTTFLSLSWFFCCKCAVPIFFMISGILLLRKKESFTQVFRKRMGRPVCALLIASLLWYLLDHGLSGFKWDELSNDRIPGYRDDQGHHRHPALRKIQSDETDGPAFAGNRHRPAADPGNEL